MAWLADETSGGWLSVSEIARVRRVDKAAISRRVARLEAAGAVTSRGSPREWRRRGAPMPALDRSG